MGYYRCERAPNEARGLVRSLMQPILRFALRAAGTRSGPSLSHLRAGVVIGNNEIRAVRARLSMNRFERANRSLSLPRVFSLSYSLTAFPPVSSLWSLAARHNARDERTERYLY